jgi:hypothetical protein
VGEHLKAEMALKIVVSAVHPRISARKLHPGELVLLPIDLITQQHILVKELVPTGKGGM